MPGLLNTNEPTQPQGSAQPPAAGPIAPPGALQNAGVAGGEGNVSPEEQTQYNEFVTNAMTMMNDKKGLKVLLEAIGGDDNPVEGLANVVTSIIIRVEDSAKKSGTEIGGDVLLHGGAEILEQAADLAEQAGVHTFTDDELETATYMAMDMYREARQSQGQIDEGKFGEDMKELQAAEADGSLEQQVPGITEYAQKQKGPPLEGEVIPAGSGPQQRGRPPQQGLLG